MHISLLLILFTVIASSAGGDEERVRSSRCTRDGSECRSLESSTCLDVTLPYKHTSTASSSSDFRNQSQIHEYLQRFTGLRKVPRCWTAFESIICTLFLPRCDAESQQSFLPTQDMCRNAKNHCKIIEPFISSLCSNQTLFPSDCENRYRDLKFLNPSATKCLSPILVPSEDAAIWFPGIEGCAYNCSDPRYSEVDKMQLDHHILYAALVGLLLTASSCVTIHISKPIQAATSAIFYQCLCIFMVNFGFFFVKKFTEKENIVCRYDSSLRYSEPGSSNENRWLCICTFLFTYFFTIAAFVWRINLSLAFSQKFDLSKSCKTKPSGRQKKTKATYHHMAAWSIPIMLIIIIICISEIDASFLIGICFVGFDNVLIRILFVLVPNAISVLVSCFFLSKCLFSLYQVQKTLCASKDESVVKKDKKQRAKIKSLSLRIGCVVVFEVVFLLIVAYANAFEYVNSPAWNEDLKSSVICSLNVTDLSLPGSEPMRGSHSCPGRDENLYQWGVKTLVDNEKPASLKHVYLQLVCVLVWSVVVSSWTWRKESLTSWRRYLLHLLRAPNLEDQKFIRMHEIVAEAYATYKNNNQIDSAISITKFNDPVGLNLTSATSNEMSTTFVDGFVNNLLNGKSAAVNSSSKSRPNGHSKRSLKSIFKRKDKYADGSSISDVSVFRSNAANSSVAESMGLGSGGNSQLSLEDMRELQATIRHQRRKTRREHKQTFNRLVTSRRGSDTSGASLVQPNRLPAQTTIKQPPQHQASQKTHPMTETQHQSRSPHTALPPELLLQMQYSMLLQQTMGQQHPHLGAHNVSTVHPFASLSRPSPLQPPQPILQPQVLPDAGNESSNQQYTCLSRIKPKIRPNLQTGTMEFSHGMTDQAKSMKNPLTEARRPDSRVPYHQPNYNVLVQPAFNPLILNSSPFHNMILNGMIPPAHLLGSQLPNFMSQSQALPANNMTSAYVPFASVPGPTVATEAELQSLVRERAECIALVAPVDSGSDFGGSVMSIAVSDSDAMHTDGESATVVSKASNSSNLMIQKAVTERMEQIEAQVAAVQSEQEEPDETEPLID